MIVTTRGRPDLVARPRRVIWVNALADVREVSFPCLGFPGDRQGKVDDFDIPLENYLLCSKGTVETKFDDGTGLVLVEESSHFLETFAKSRLEDIMLNPYFSHLIHNSWFSQSP